MDILDMIENGFLEPSQYSHEAIVPRHLVKTLCQMTGCTDEKLMRLQLQAILNGAIKQELWDGQDVLPNFSERVLTETVASERVNTYNPEMDGLLVMFEADASPAIDFRKAKF